MIGYSTIELPDLHAPGLFNSKGNKPMTTESRMREAASRAFVTAFLLVGDAERAEAAVLRSIALTNFDDASGDELIPRVVNDAIEPEEMPERFPRKLEPAFSMLPFELQRVLQLPHYLRQCFVLRVLVGLPREICARLLHSNVQQIDRCTRAAMLQLPAFRGTSLASPSPIRREHGFS
jgi:hypothetical protein